MQRGDMPSGVCGKVSHRRESFRTHLQNSHSLDNGEVLESKLESCRIGRNYEARFWCGFCEAIVESKQKGLGAWNERFDHIDNHFVGKNNLAPREISDWKNVDPDQPRPDLSAPDSEDSDQSPSPPPTIERAKNLGKQATQYLKQRSKKKGVDSDGRAFKRRRGHLPIEHRCVSKLRTSQ